MVGQEPDRADVAMHVVAQRGDGNVAQRGEDEGVGDAQAAAHQAYASMHAKAAQQKAQKKQREAA